MNNPKKRILVVDDQADITRMLKLNLEQTNEYEVRTENDSHLALSAAKEFHPDLILLDVVMPGIDGGELASRFAASPGLEGVPIVFLTAAATKGEVSGHGGRIGGLPFLAKPVNTSEVLKCLKKHLASPWPNPMVSAASRCPPGASSGAGSWG
ncbi:MAG: two-component system response regulator [Limisphaerales bacterium]